MGTVRCSCAWTRVVQTPEGFPTMNGGIRSRTRGGRGRRLTGDLGALMLALGHWWVRTRRGDEGRSAMPWALLLWCLLLCLGCARRLSPRESPQVFLASMQRRMEAGLEILYFSAQI